MIYTDTHLHSSFSSDSDTPMELMIKQGIRLGMKTLCFTEHYDPCYPDTPDGLDFLLDFENYKKTLFTLKEKYASQIEILYGLELGVQPHLGQTLANFYKKYGNDFDFIINSCHILSHQPPEKMSQTGTTACMLVIVLDQMSDILHTMRSAPFSDRP